jgi:hypothetical protein
MLENLVIVRPPKINHLWTIQDYLGTLKVRLSFGRDDYKIKPGLYAFQKPGPDSEVFVTANYKLSFDLLRRELAGLNAWILVLDTKGINVWCAAGKGTFGTNELVKQINETQLSNMLNHKRLIVPQLGAPGINAQQVRLNSGFQVKFGPVRASDIKPYLEAGLKKTEEMSTVKFNAIDRLKVVPVEIVNSLTKFIIIAILIFLISALSLKDHTLHLSIIPGLNVISLLFVAYLGGSAITPFLLPWIPFRSFSAKGIVVGAILMGISLTILPMQNSLITNIGVFLIGMSITSFLAMNFTGASTYTSLSGVRKEMRIFVPVQTIAALLGLIFFVVSRFINSY